MDTVEPLRTNMIKNKTNNCTKHLQNNFFNEERHQARYRCKMTMVQDPEAGTSLPPPPLEVRPGSLVAGDGFLPEALVFKVFKVFNNIFTNVESYVVVVVVVLPDC